LHGHATIEGHQPAAVPHGQPEKIDIGNLIGTEDERWVEQRLVGDGDIVRPELIYGRCRKVAAARSRREGRASQ
jgi:hypothetical protein